MDELLARILSNIGLSEFVFLALGVFSFFYFLSLKRKDKEFDLVRKGQEIIDKNLETGKYLSSVADAYRERLDKCEERNDILEQKLRAMKNGDD